MPELISKVTRPQGDHLSFTQVLEPIADGAKEYEMIRIDALYFLSACADANLPHYHDRLLKEQHRLDQMRNKPETEPAALTKQEHRCKALQIQYRHLSRAARHYMHYRMYQNVLALVDETQKLAEAQDSQKIVEETQQPHDRQDPQKIDALTAALDEYIRRFEDSGFYYYLRRTTTRTKESFGSGNNLFYICDHEGRPLDIKDKEVKLPTDFVDPGVKIFGLKKKKEDYLKHLYSIHQHPDLPVEARILFKHLNDFQAEVAVKQDPTAEPAKTGSAFVEVKRPATPTQKWVGRIGLLAGIGFTLLATVGTFAVLTTLLPIWPAVGLTGVLCLVDILRNKDDFYDQLLRFAKQFELNHPYKNGFHYKGLMEKRSGRVTLSLFLRTLVGFEFFAVAVPGGYGLVEAGKTVFSRLFSQLNTNGTWLQLLNPLFYAAAISCVMISFFVPATAWTDYWGIHLDDVKPEHQFDVGLAREQVVRDYAPIARIAENGSALAQEQESNEVELEGLDVVRPTPQPIDTYRAFSVMKTRDIGELVGSNSVTAELEARDCKFELARHPRLVA